MRITITLDLSEYVYSIKHLHSYLPFRHIAEKILEYYVQYAKKVVYDENMARKLSYLADFVPQTKQRCVSQILF